MDSSSLLKYGSFSTDHSQHPPDRRRKLRATIRKRKPTVCTKSNLYLDLKVPLSGLKSITSLKTFRPKLYLQVLSLLLPSRNTHPIHLCVSELTLVIKPTQRRYGVGSAVATTIRALSSHRGRFDRFSALDFSRRGRFAELGGVLRKSWSMAFRKYKFDFNTLTVGEKTSAEITIAPTSVRTQRSLRYSSRLTFELLKATPRVQ